MYDKMMKKIFLGILVFPSLFFSQVVITPVDNAATGVKPDPSAIMEVRNDKKGILFPEAPLTSPTDATTVNGPVEATTVLNTNTNSTAPAIPTKKQTLAVWDGTKWLFNYTDNDINASLDVVKVFNADSGVIPVSFTTFPTTSPVATLGESSSANNWKVLVNSNTAVNGEPNFSYTSAIAKQKMVIEAEGMATVNSSDSDYADFGFEVGIFLDDKLVTAKKYFRPIITNASCSYSKYSINAIIDDQTYFTKAVGATYNVKLAVRPLPRRANNYNRLVFGDNAGFYWNSSTSSCTNLSKDSARSYMSILTIETRY